MERVKRAYICLTAAIGVCDIDYDSPQYAACRRRRAVYGATLIGVPVGVRVFVAV